MSIHWRLHHCLACLSQRRAHQLMQSTKPQCRTLSCFVRLKKEPAPAYHHPGIAPPIVPSQTMPSVSPSGANFGIEQETDFWDKPDIGHTKKIKGIPYTIRVSPRILKKVDLPLAPSISTPVAQGSYVGRWRT
ncbi:hypothetical protein BKA70DRAFT_1570355 [Coprinopsis sp. MPI-PUGE-AT-0042]|nr:hypothetical protein BKA70DRAFT_1570355 [Coprinopsis sp. MPI-PUGE-AT-0042]